MMQRLLVTAIAGACLAVPTVASAGAESAAASWAKTEIRVVVARGLMAPDVKSFRPEDDLTRNELAQLASGLTGRPARRPSGPDTSVTIAELDKRLVDALHLSRPATDFTTAARARGLDVPSRFGTEIVARLLGLRTNHPAGQDDLERFPNEPAPRAEAAFSGARALELVDSDRARVSAAPLRAPQARRMAEPDPSDGVLARR